MTDAVLSCINEDKYDVIILNFANCDMVGHTGVMAAAMKAVKTVDECVGKVVDAIIAHGRQVHHHRRPRQRRSDDRPRSRRPVHRAHHQPGAGDRHRPGASASRTLRQGGRLCDLCPTMLDMMGLPKPAEMTGESLIKH